LNRAEVLNVLLALVVLHHIFDKNSRGLALVKVRLFLLRVRDERVTNSINPIKKRIEEAQYEKLYSFDGCVFFVDIIYC